MTGTPRVSIGLPVYNGERYLAEAIEALLGQTYEDFELIISDNASTDDTAAICHSYGQIDRRIRYFRQARNIGLAPNHNFVVEKATGEYFKFAHYDDLCARSLLERCVEALDARPEAVLAYTDSAAIDSAGTVTSLIPYVTSPDLPSAPERFESMLIGGWEDYYGGVLRLTALRAIAPHDSYHFADRVYPVELALHGPFHMVPECLQFRRVHQEQAGRRSDMHERCAILDPRRSDRLRHPVVRLYGEYLWGYVRAIRNAPLSSSEQNKCYWTLTKWMGQRANPVFNRILGKEGLATQDKYKDVAIPISLDALVAGRAR